jgi:hypothetical protein
VDRKLVFRRIDTTIYSKVWDTSKGATILIGEFIEETLSLLLFDVLMIEGERVMDVPQFSARLERMNVELSKEGLFAGPLKLIAKRFCKKARVAEDVFSHIHPSQSRRSEYVYEDDDRRNGNDGVIATPENGTFFEPTLPIFKWKWPGMNTIDFMTFAPWYDRDGNLALYMPGTVLTPEGQRPTSAFMYMHVRSTKLGQNTKKWFDDQIRDAGPRRNGCVLECAYDAESSRWTPKRFRFDKSTANLAQTCFSTLENIVDNVTDKDIIEACRQPLDFRVPVRVVFDSTTKEKSLVVLQNVAAGTVLWQFDAVSSINRGTMTLTMAQIQELPEPQKSTFMRHCWQNDWDLWSGCVDGDPSRDYTNFLNHRCFNPSAWFHGDDKLVARKDMRAGDQITIEYATCDTAFAAFDGECTCGSPHCRKIISNKDFLRADIQKQFKGHYRQFLEKRLFA